MSSHWKFNPFVRSMAVTSTSHSCLMRKVKRDKETEVFQDCLEGVNMQDLAFYWSRRGWLDKEIVFYYSFYFKCLKRHVTPSNDENCLGIKITGVIESSHLDSLVTGWLLKNVGKT